MTSPQVVALDAAYYAAIVQPGVAGYERVVHLPTCGRCIQLALLGWP